MSELSSPTPSAVDARFNQPQYLFRRRVLVLLGARIDVYDPAGRPVLFCQQKAFKLKEDIRLYENESKTRELLTIKARNIIDFSAAYDVTDPQTGEHIGVLRRKGFASMVRDAWEVLSPQGQLLAKIEEDNLLLALVRRLLTNLIPQSFHFITPEGAELSKAHQNFNPFVHKLTVEMPQGPMAQRLDPRLVLAASTLLVLIEGRQG